MNLQLKEKKKDGRVVGNHPGRPRLSSSSLSQKENGRQIKIEKESSGNKRVAGFYTLSFYTHRDTQRVFFSILSSLLCYPEFRKLVKERYTSLADEKKR
jgi:hypothetical protein